MRVGFLSKAGVDIAEMKKRFAPQELEDFLED